MAGARALGWKVNLHRLSILALLCGCINLGHGVGDSSQSFRIGEKYIPASPDYLSVYIVTEGEELSIVCNHTQTEGSGWFAESVDRTVPQGDPIPIGENIMVGADGDTLFFSNPATPGLEGIYSCAGDTLRIFLTFDNPYVNIEGPDPLSIMLVDVFQLLAVTLYKVDGEQRPAELSTVTVTATEMGDLNIVGTSASDPFRTIYEVARPDGLVQATLTLKVEVNGMSGNDSLNLLVEDLYEGLKATTVVLEGDTVMLNCTPTLPDATVTFSGSAVSEFPPVNNVLSFPALERLDGFYRCTVMFASSTRIFPFTVVRIVPDDRDVLYESSGQLPTPYIVLNDPRSEGLTFTCITRSGTLTVTSENTTITEQIAAINGIGLVDVGSDEVFDVITGDQFIQMEISDLDSVYGDTLTCQSSDFSDSVSIVVVPGGTYVALYPDDITMVTADYGQSINISFFYATAENSPITLLRNGEDITQQAEFGQNPPVLPDHNQVRYYEVTLNASSAGLYILPNNGAGSPNASFFLNVNLPTVTVSPEELKVEEGATFTITCTSSISSLPLVWLVPETPVQFSEPNGNQATVISADRRSEGTYTCQFREDGTVLASATATVNVLLRCPEEYAGGILWSSVAEDTVAAASCRDADSRFSSGLVVTRLCYQGEWLGPNFSGCTLTSGEPQAFIIFSLHYQVLSGSETEIRASEDIIKNELDATTMTTSPQSTSLEIVPDFAQLLSDGFPVDIVRLRYTVSYNFSVTSNLFELLPGVNRDLHCSNDIIAEEIINLRAATFPVVGDSYGFQRSDFCECRISSNLRGLVQEERRRKRGFFCPVPSPNFQEICNGTLAAPCSCVGQVGTESVSTECQCIDPFVGDDSLCTLDQDSDSYPALPLRTCGEGDNATYCIVDSCPTVPNIDPTDNSSCTGLDAVSCEAEIDEVWRIEWPFIPTNEVATVSCGANFIGTTSRQCLTNGSWADPDVSNCSSRVFVSVQARAAGLSVAENREEVIFLLDELVVATSETVTPVFPQDLEISSDLVNDTLTQLFEQLDMGGEGNLNNTNTIFELLDNLLMDVNLQSFEVLQKAGAGSERVLDNVERYALYVARVLQEGNTPDLTINQTGDNIVLRAESIPVVGMVEDYVFPEPGEADSLAVTNGSEASIIIPQELLVDRAEGVDSVGVAHLLFRNLQAFLPNDIVSTEPESLVISSQVSRRGGTAFVEEVLEDNPVLITFSFEVAEGSDLSTSDVQCVFWDFGNSDSDLDLSGWSTEAVRTVSVTREGDTVTVTCASTHLTSFAVLVDVGGAQLESQALTIVSYIGLAISLACLLLTIVFFLTFGKNLFTAVHNFVHLNLAIALFIGYLVFAIGVELAKDNKIACNVVTALIQYFLLSAFCWMMCEGVMLYLMLVVVFSKISKKWWFFLLLGWGPPVIFVVIGLATVHDEYGVKDESGDYKYCWLSSGDGTYAIWAFVAPMLAIIIINTVFLVLVLYSIFRNRAGRHKSLQEGIKVDVVISVVKASLILLPLLGLTWVFGLFAVNENTAVFAWLFTIFNSLQGVFIFFFHVVRNDRVWGRMKKKYSAYSASRASKSTASTGTGKHTSRAHRLGYSSNVGTELKEKESYVSEHRASEVKVPLDEPTKDEPA